MDIKGRNLGFHAVFPLTMKRKQNQMMKGADMIVSKGSMFPFDC